MSLIKVAMKLVGRTGNGSLIDTGINMLARTAKAAAEHGETRAGKKAIIGIMQKYKKTGRNNEVLNKLKNVHGFGKQIPKNKAHIEKIFESSVKNKAFQKLKTIKNPTEYKIFANKLADEF